MDKKLMVDTCVRLILANQGNVSYEDTMKAMEHISRNSARGLFPTTGGAVSLMFSGHVDGLFERNRGWFAKFRPVVPDKGNAPAKSLEDWRAAAIEQALFKAGEKGTRPFRVSEVRGMDGVLLSYEGRVDWRRIHNYATSLDSSVEPYQHGPNWLSDGSGPLSVLAFCGAEVRHAAAPYRYS